MHLDMVRPGVILYGDAPTADCAGILNLHPAMTLKSTIAMVKEVGKDAQVSYGRTFTAPQDMLVATLPVGYADGLNRHLGNGAWEMIVGGAKAKTIGNICMDSCMIDITDIEGIEEGDEVIIFSAERGNTAEDMARVLDTISYEIMTSISQRVKRIYTER